MSRKPNPTPTPKEMFESAARAICPGEAWQAALADLMGIRRDSVRQFLRGRLHLRTDHFETLLRLVTERQTELAKVEAQLREWLARQPNEDRS
jgi:hypothetical protein